MLGLTRRKNELSSVESAFAKATELLLVRQFMNEIGDMAWSGEDRSSMGGTVTWLIGQAGYLAGHAAAKAAPPAAAPMLVG